MKFDVLDSLQIIDICEREQRRIGQDIHDGLGQILTGIAFLSKLLEQKLTAKDIAEADHAAEITRLVRDAINQTRILVRALNPVRLEAEGLMLSLEELACNTERVFGISCRFKCKKGIPIRNHEIGKNLYRIVQEAVNNAIKHGNAKHIVIGLDCADNRITLTVKDDGVGFPASGKNSEGMGVKIMRTRAQSIGALLTIQRASAGGTIITCSVLQAHTKAK